MAGLIGNLGMMAPPTQNTGLAGLMQGYQAGFMPYQLQSQLMLNQANAANLYGQAQYYSGRGNYYNQYGNVVAPALAAQDYANAQEKGAMANVLIPSKANLAQSQATNEAIIAQKNSASAAQIYQEAVQNGFNPTSALQMSKNYLTQQQNAMAVAGSQYPFGQIPGQQNVGSMGVAPLPPSSNSGLASAQVPTNPQNVQQTNALQQRLDDVTTQLGQQQSQQQQVQGLTNNQIMSQLPTDISNIPVSGPLLPTDVSFTRALENSPNFISTLDNATNMLSDPRYQQFTGSQGALARERNKLMSYAHLASPDYGDFIGKSQDLTLNAESMAKAFTNTNAFSGIELNTGLLVPNSNEYPNAQSQLSAVQDFALSYADRLASQLKMNYKPQDRAAILNSLQQLQNSKTYQMAISNPANVHAYGGYNSQDIQQLMQSYNMTIPQAYAFIDTHGAGSKK